MLLDREQPEDLIEYEDDEENWEEDAESWSLASFSAVDAVEDEEFDDPDDWEYDPPDYTPRDFPIDYS